MSGAKARIREATIDLVVADGVEATTIEAVVARAGVSRADFDALYEDKQNLMLSLWREIADDFEIVVYGAFEAHDSWRDGLRACAYAAAKYIGDRPREARFGILQMFNAGEVARAYREEQLQQMVDLVDRGRQELDDPDSIGRGVAEGVIGSIYTLLVKELQSGRGVSASVDYVPQMMYLAVRPYLGHEVAREELTIPPPSRERS